MKILPTGVAPPTDGLRDGVRRTLLEQWDAGRRDLPWRRTADPYGILVSELMLQQTQVDRVAPAWETFMSRFPTLETLAEAGVAEVIRAWKGLGYNRRAVHLHRLAVVCRERHGGRLPHTVAELAALPGVGPYTARAVASIAFGLPVAAVDTNVRRLLTRLVDGGSRPRPPRALQQLADSLLAVERPGDWNQALMEHGALVCTAAAPRCPPCRLRPWCAAAAAGALAVREERPAYHAGRGARAGRFEHSARYYRGRIVDALRDAGSEGISPERLGSLLRPEFQGSPEGRAWLADLLTALARDGLVAWDGGGSVRLPD